VGDKCVENATVLPGRGRYLGSSSCMNQCSVPAAAPWPYRWWPRCNRSFSAAPIFNSSTDLDADTGGWKAYLDGVYTLATLTYPLDTAQFQVFYHYNCSGIPSLGGGGCLDAPDSLMGELKHKLNRSMPWVSWRPNYCQTFVFYRWQEYYRVPDVDVIWTYLYHDQSTEGNAPVAPHVPAEGVPRTPSTASPSPAGGFPSANFGQASSTWIEVQHAGRDANNPSEVSGFWMYEARGSGIYYNLGQTGECCHRRALARPTTPHAYMHQLKSCWLHVGSSCSDLP
jgi:hypothetical protein